MEAHQHIHSSNTNEWYTPHIYIDAAREVMGGIDLDPASTDEANGTVQALKYFTAKHDGLTHNWYGRVWLNPPYGSHNGKSNQARWSQYLLQQYSSCSVRQAVLLVNAVPGEKWFQPLFAYPICFTNHRIRFIPASGEPQKSPTHSNAFIYLGPKRTRFVEVFSQHGTVVRRAEWA